MLIQHNCINIRKDERDPKGPCCFHAFNTFCSEWTKRLLVFTKTASLSSSTHKWILVKKFWWSTSINLKFIEVQKKATTTIITYLISYFRKSGMLKVHHGLPFYKDILSISYVQNFPRGIQYTKTDVQLDREVIISAMTTKGLTWLDEYYTKPFISDCKWFWNFSIRVSKSFLIVQIQL